ncbi:LpqB family beta-propeller domain-containing protein [Streptomyces sp. NPDC003042]
MEDAERTRGAGSGRGRPRRAPVRSWAALGAAGLLLAGCASMPDRGEIRRVEASQGVDSQVRVFGVPPADKAGAADIVDGFLEAMTSDDPQLDTARKYLTEDAAKNWQPGSAVTVLSAGLSRVPVQSEKDPEDPEEPRWKVSGKKLATVDERSAYQPETGGGRYEEYLQLVQVKGQWRIATPPSSLVLSESDFQRIYKPVNKYYFAGNSLVADPVYVRQRSDPDSRMDPTTQTVRSLLAGPSKWLGPVVSTSFPAGTELLEGTKSLSYDGQNTLRVPLNRNAESAPQPQCQKMATQLLYTVRDLTGSRLERVELLRANGKASLCWVTWAAAEVIANRPRPPEHQYYVDKDFRLVRMVLDVNAEDQQQDKPELAPGPLATATGFKVGSAAVAYDEKRAAVVSDDEHGLYVVTLTTAGAMPQPLLSSKAGKLTAPSWDAHGDLWIAELDPQNQHQTLWRVPGGTGTPQKVDVAGLNGGKIAALKASSDGVRLALLVEKEGGRKNLFTGRIERPGGTGATAPVSVRELRPAAPQMAEVTAMSWAPRGRLLVVGRESGGVDQARYMLADGSMVAASLPGATGLVAIAAAEDETQPVVAFSKGDGIVWLPPGAQWRTVAAGGRAPVYPG